MVLPAEEGVVLVASATVLNGVEEAGPNYTLLPPKEKKKDRRKRQREEAVARQQQAQPQAEAEAAAVGAVGNGAAPREAEGGAAGAADGVEAVAPRPRLRSARRCSDRVNTQIFWRFSAGCRGCSCRSPEVTSRSRYG